VTTRHTKGENTQSNLLPAYLIQNKTLHTVATDYTLALNSTIQNSGEIFRFVGTRSHGLGYDMI